MSDVGLLLRRWRTTRRMSQLDLSAQAGVSARHLSFLETGRARPTREMILRLAEQLAVPLRSRNELLLAGGFAPAYAESDLGGAAAGRGPRVAARRAGRPRALPGAAGRPALDHDRRERRRRSAAGRLRAWLLEPPVNVLRASLHPDGMAPRIENLAEWRTHVLHRLDRQAAATADPVLRELHAELDRLPRRHQRHPPDGLVGPAALRRPLASSASPRSSAPRST